MAFLKDKEAPVEEDVEIFDIDEAVRLNLADAPTMIILDFADENTARCVWFTKHDECRIQTFPLEVLHHIDP